MRAISLPACLPCLLALLEQSRAEQRSVAVSCDLAPSPPPSPRLSVSVSASASAIHVASTHAHHPWPTQPSNPETSLEWRLIGDSYRESADAFWLLQGSVCTYEQQQQQQRQQQQGEKQIERRGIINADEGLPGKSVLRRLFWTTTTTTTSWMRMSNCSLLACFFFLSSFSFSSLAWLALHVLDTIEQS